MAWKVPLFDIDINQEEIDAATQVLQSGWLTMGDKTRQFEAALGEMLGSKHVFVVNNGTAALHLALAAAGIGPGDEIIVPSLTFVATANAIIYTGAVPVFADVVSEADFTISPKDIRAKITPNTKGIMVMHYGGFPCHMDEINQIAQEEGLLVFEDTAHAPGARLHGKACGTFGVCGCFSFFSNKNMSMGEGGAVITDDDAVAEKIRLMRSHGMTTLTLDRYKGHSYSYDVVLPGYNYRPTEMQAALGFEQLKKLPGYNSRRAEITRQYYQKLEGVSGLSVPFKNHTGESCYHIFPILLDPEIDRTEFMGFLKENGVQTSIHYPPIHTFSHHCNLTESIRGNLELTEDICRREVTLPLYPKMTEKDVDTVVDVIKQFMQR